jgi:hypothetical protein
MMVNLGNLWGVSSTRVFDIFDTNPLGVTPASCRAFTPLFLLPSRTKQTVFWTLTLFVVERRGRPAQYAPQIEKIVTKEGDLKHRIGV